MIKFKFTSARTVIYDVLRYMGWKQTDHETEWNFHWCERDWMVDVYDQVHFRLASTQKINHYRNSREVSRKDLLIKNVKKLERYMKKNGGCALLENRKSIIPVSFVLPREHALFVEEFKKNKHKKENLWIMKPTGKCQGRGIFIIQKLSEVSKWKNNRSHTLISTADESNEVENYVVQKYISRPLLLGGRKFDLRLYVLVTSFRPLQIWLHRGGFARFSSRKYNTSSNDIKNSFVHLTNVAVQKKSSNYDRNIGSKMDLFNLKRLLILYFSLDEILTLFRQIEDIIVFSLQSVENVMMQDKRCFELFGYDIIIDTKLKPWLLEVNASPALNSSTEKDYEFKFKMLMDMLHVIDVEGKRNGKEIRVGGFDKIFSSKRLNFDSECMNKTFLGCRIPDQENDEFLREKAELVSNKENKEQNKVPKHCKKVWK
eukprot:maker-scaffold_1-snap-gene-6.0-mRNA-1 protein AED:0.06 eAED:0.06 QI:0/0/0/1/1/1/3/0/428